MFEVFRAHGISVRHTINQITERQNFFETARKCGQNLMFDTNSEASKHPSRHCQVGIYKTVYKTDL